MVGPWIAFLKARGGRKLSDIEYLAIKDFDGKRVDVDAGPITITNTVTETDIVTLTANSGKDLYLADAVLRGYNDTGSNSSFNMRARLYLNGVEVESFQFEVVAVSGSYKIEFKTKGIAVAATEIIKITLQHSSASATRITKNYGKLVAFEETTDESPAIA